MADKHINPTLEPIFYFVAVSLDSIQRGFNAVPGSGVLVRYVKSSHQNDPFRTLLELCLFIFAVWTLVQSRTRADRGGKHFIRFSEQEIDELVEEWTPEPLVSPLTEQEQMDLDSIPVVVGHPGPKPKLQSTGKTLTNLSSYNFAGLAGNEAIKQHAVKILRKHGLGACGPPGFYGTVDVHIDLERNIAQFLGTEDAIIYSQGFSTISSVIPAFCKRGDIIVADRGVNFAIHRGIQISRSTVRWYDHNDMSSLEEVMNSVVKEMKKKKMPLARRFIITEGIFENDGAMSDLPKLVELKEKFKYRLLLDESISFGTMGRTGRGLTELYNVSAGNIDLIVGSLSNTLCGTGGFCAGSEVAVKHQRINGSAFVFSASMPPLLATTASEGINILTSTPSILTALHTNILAIRSVLNRLECVTIPSHPHSPIIHICIRSPLDSSTSNRSLLSPDAAGPKIALERVSNPASLAPREPHYFDIPTEEKLLQDVVDECLSQGVLVTRAKRLRGQESLDPRPSLKICATAALSKKDTEKAANVLKNALSKVIGKR
ncbi:serine palmitoyltransferase [Cantharellus anzutake]|uniref:serine palmitoyltransferase n=1 Tax=Cantharellus anzutake TaxID=1750568 RepID=UPI001904DC8E|nr:serine palmitoyltransferase [Cantharellus anzutake]KAF8332647.1 serine palmitoyltransferase [Cantharellus anzutake]